MDTIVLVITWSGSQEARLYYLLDNDTLVSGHNARVNVATSQVVGRGEVHLTYDILAAAAHRLEWSLVFPGKTLADLKAHATLNAEQPVTQSAEDDQKNHWVGGVDL